MDPFVVLIYEGIIGFLLSFLLFIKHNFLKDIRKFFSESNDKDKIGLVFALFFYMVTSGGKNIFRVVTTLKLIILS